MEFTTNEYKRSVGKVFTTSGGKKYILSKHKGNFIYLRHVLFRNTCKGTSILNCETNLITPLKGHNHDLAKYKSDIYDLKTKCKMITKISQTNLRKVFDDTTRDSPFACKSRFLNVSLQCTVRERLWNLKWHRTLEFSDMIHNTTFGKYFQFSVRIGDHTDVVFFSEKMMLFLSDVTDIQFGGTFFTVPIQFTQLWTLFVPIELSSLPATYCLMTGKG